MEACDEPDCAATLKELELFLDDEMPTDARRAVAHHLDDCPDCEHAFDFYAELKTVIAKKCHSDEMPPGLLAKIEQCFSTDGDGANS